MTTDDKKPYFKLHGIQLISVNVVELFIKVNVPLNEKMAEDSDLSLKSGHGDYDEDNRTIQVGVQLDYGMGEESKTPYSMRIELFGDFEVDEELFDKEHLEHWARKNAPLILFPFLREHAYALAIRCGFDPLILPLLQVPALTRG
jgi:preprotein translocase subunit SecB